jgi:protein-tyrosine phosphatase
LSGCFNFRDLGGYPTVNDRRVRWRTLFRADGLARLDASDRASLAELGLTTVVDLRTGWEAHEWGQHPYGPFEVEYHHLPLTDIPPLDEDLARYTDPEFVTARYHRLLTDGASSIGRAVEVLAEPGALPAVFHCSAGKDRTGVLAALILGFLGVPEEVIVDDYALSSKVMGDMLEWMRAEYGGDAVSFERYAPAVISVHPEAMAGFLSSLRKDHGGFAELALTLGVSDAVERLKESLLIAPDRDGIAGVS